jgi:hypothetical protein
MLEAHGPELAHGGDAGREDRARDDRPTGRSAIRSTLSILLVAATAFVLPTWPMIVIALTNATLVNLKARNEERHLRDARGCHAGTASTGRFSCRCSRRTASALVAALALAAGARPTSRRSTARRRMS